MKKKGVKIMKYNKGKIVDENGIREINLEGIKEKDVEGLIGKLFCPGENCMAPLYLVHNPNDGGKTIFFKATREQHIDGCDYKDDISQGGVSKATSTNGYYTEDQINTYVRNLYKDLNTPPEEKNKNGNAGGNNNSKSTKTSIGTGTDDGKTKIIGGRIVQGNEEIEEGSKGRMSRRFSVSESDIGAQIGVYGSIESFDIDKYGQARITFEDNRYSNIIVLIGQIYKNLNEQEFSYLIRAKEYYDYLKSQNRRVDLVAGGLVTKYNEQLTVELQAKYSFRINGYNILDIVRGRCQ